MKLSRQTIRKYNTLCTHYEIVANACYKKREKTTSALSEDYFPFLIAALIVFDMQRQMDKGLKLKYDKDANGFASRLNRILSNLKTELDSFENMSIDTIDLDLHSESIKEIYETLAKKNRLTANGKAFHVGATKLMHFMYPNLFPIIDSNTAKVLKRKFGVSYKTQTQPGYNSKKYIQSMLAIQKYVNETGVRLFIETEPGTPLTRIFDKLAFVEGAGL